ncbi:MAG: class I SAM-dependent methyltransferase [Actinomadura sp.]
MGTYVTKRKVRFGIIDRQLGNPDWTGKRVLDFGGSAGNILLDPECSIEPSNYWCIEISRDAIAEGQRRHLEGHFIFYDRYNYEYNPTGTVGEPIPDPGVRFDIIFAWSVITHNNEIDSRKLIDQLTALLADGGKLAFTFLDPLWAPPPTWSAQSTSSDLSRLDELIMGIQDNKPDIDNSSLQSWATKSAYRDDSVNWSNLRWQLEKLHAINPNVNVAEVLAQVDNTSLTWLALVNGERSVTLAIDPDGAELPEEDPQNPVTHRLAGYLNFCTTEYMSRLFPDAQIRAPAMPDRMHCAIVEKHNGPD